MRGGHAAPHEWDYDSSIEFLSIFAVCAQVKDAVVLAVDHAVPGSPAQSIQRKVVALDHINKVQFPLSDRRTSGILPASPPGTPV